MNKKLIIMLLLITLIIPITHHTVRAASTNMNSIDYWFTKVEPLVYKSKYSMSSHFEIDAEQNRYILIYDENTDIDYVLKVSKDGLLLWYKSINLENELESISNFVGEFRNNPTFYQGKFIDKNRSNIYIYNNKIYYTKNYVLRSTNSILRNTMASIVLDSNTGDKISIEPTNYFINTIVAGKYAIVSSSYNLDLYDIESKDLIHVDAGSAHDLWSISAYLISKEYFTYNVVFDNEDDESSVSEYLVYVDAQGNLIKRQIRYNEIVGYDTYALSSIPENVNKITSYFFIGNSKNYIIENIVNDWASTYKLKTVDSLKPYFSNYINTENEMVYCKLEGSEYVVAYTTINSPYTYTKDTYLASDLTARQRAAWTASDKTFVSKKSFILGKTIYSNELDLNTYTYAKAPSATISNSKIAVGDNTNFTLTGTAKDLNDSTNTVTIEITINGIKKSMNTSNGTYAITFNSAEIGEGLHDITVVVKDKLGLTKTITQERILDIDFTLKDFLNSIDILSNQSQIARVIILDSAQRIIDDNTSNQSIINSIATKVNSKDVGLYIIDNGNKILKDLANKIN